MWPVTSHVDKRATCIIFTQPNGRKHTILYFMEFAPPNSCHLLLLWKGGTSQKVSSFYFHNSWIYVEIMTQMSTFPFWPVQYLACQKIQRMYKVILTLNYCYRFKVVVYSVLKSFQIVTGELLFNKGSFSVLLVLIHFWLTVRKHA